MSSPNPRVRPPAHAKSCTTSANGPMGERIVSFHSYVRARRDRWLITTRTPRLIRSVRRSNPNGLLGSTMVNRTFADVSTMTTTPRTKIGQFTPRPPRSPRSTGPTGSTGPADLPTRRLAVGRTPRVTRRAHTRWAPDEDGEGRGADAPPADCECQLRRRDRR